MAVVAGSARLPITHPQSWPQRPWILTLVTLPGLLALVGGTRRGKVRRDPGTRSGQVPACGAVDHVRVGVPGARPATAVADEVGGDRWIRLRFGIGCVWGPAFAGHGQR